MHAHRLADVGFGDMLRQVAGPIDHRHPIVGIFGAGVVEGAGFPLAIHKALDGEEGEPGDFGFPDARQRPPPGTKGASRPSSALRHVTVWPAPNPSRPATT